MFGPEFGEASRDVPGEFTPFVPGEFQVAQQASAAGVEVVDAAAQRGQAVLAVAFGLGVDAGQCADEQGVPVRSEHMVGEEVEHLGEEVFLPHPQALGVPVGCAAGGLAGVVGGAVVAELAEHPPAAAVGVAEHVGAQGVGAAGLRVCTVGSGSAAGAFPAFVGSERGSERLDADEWLVSRVGRPDPLADRIDLAAAAAHRAPVPHHVAGVLGVADQVTHRTLGPAADRAGGIGWFGRRVAVGGGVAPQPALELTRATLDRLADGLGTAGPGHVSLWGTLHLQAALISAYWMRRHDAESHLCDAEEAAWRLGGDANHYDTMFGPTNVAIHRVAVAVELGDAGTALRHGTRLNTSGVGRERRARLHIDIARAFQHAGRRDKALTALRVAEKLAPDYVRPHPIVHELVGTQMRRMTPELRAFAQRIGAL